MSENTENQVENPKEEDTLLNQVNDDENVDEKSLQEDEAVNLDISNEEEEVENEEDVEEENDVEEKLDDEDLDENLELKEEVSPEEKEDISEENEMKERVLQSRKINELRPNLRYINVMAKIIQKSEKRTVENPKTQETHDVADVLVGDETGTVVLSAWNEAIENLEVNKSYLFQNCKTILFKGHIRLSMGKNGEYIVSEDPIKDINLEFNASDRYYRRYGGRFRRRNYHGGYNRGYSNRGYNNRYRNNDNYQSNNQMNDSSSDQMDDSNL